MDRRQATLQQAMIISELISRLTELRDEHGEDVPVERFSEDWGCVFVQEVRLIPKDEAKGNKETTVMIL